MGATIFSGPSIEYGLMGYVVSGELSPNNPVPDPNIDAGPSMTYQGDALPDCRYTFLKDKVQGYNGVVPAFLNLAYLQSVDQIPVAKGTAVIAALANAVSGTPMVLATTQVAGIAPAIPIIPWITGAGANNELNASNPVTAAIALDFGFAFGNVTAGAASIVVADTTQFQVGMPLVIANVGNALGTAAHLCNVQSITDATHIVVSPAPLATLNPTAIGTGNIWGFREGVGYPVPTAAFPYIAAGPGLFLHPAQTVARAVSITGVASGTGGAFTVRGWDVFGQPMSETITVGAGVNTVNGKKAFKYIASVTPGFNDAHTYSVGTTDLFGFHYRSRRWEYTNEFFNGTFATTSNGWTAGDTTSPATATTGDVRGTIDVTNASGFNSASNGTISSLAMSGRRLSIFQSISVDDMLAATPFNPAPLFGQLQFTS